jgi:flagellar assembly protein FliH
MSSKVLTGMNAECVEVIQWPRVAESGPSGANDEKAVEKPEPGPSAEEILEQRTREAHRTGFMEGEAAAKKAAAARLDAVATAFTDTIQELAGWRGRMRREAEKDMIQLALAIARHVIQREVNVDPEVLLGVAKAALAHLEAREVYRVRVNPEDLPLLGKHLETLGLARTVEIVPDAVLTRGGAIFETEKGDLDASLDGQLGEIERGLTDIARRRS